MLKTDVLIIGSGIAGLTYALHLAQKRPDLAITIITKGEAQDSNTVCAQGGIAAVVDLLHDSLEQHIEDTIRAGKGFSDPDIVRMVITNAADRINNLLEWGVPFDKNDEGALDLHLEGGHSGSRIVHCKDFTGLEIEKVLLERIGKHTNISLLPYFFAIDLMTVLDVGRSNKNGLTCSGAMVLDEKAGTVFPIKAKITILSTGGMGQVYEKTTNPKVATGDGVAMAFRVGATIRDMHFVQFHPTAFYNEGNDSSFLISEAVRGFGAHLVNRDEKRFMLKYDSRAELATRDIISMAIETELVLSGDKHVFLDCRHLDPQAFQIHFPTIYRYCLDKGIDISTTLIPVAPAAHYQCGGIEVNMNSETSINHLLAIGECASTGLHGANRLASNSLLEALVYAHSAFLHTARIINEIPYLRDSKNLASDDKPALDQFAINAIKDGIRSVMSRHAGINRSIESIQVAKKSLLIKQKEIDTSLKKYRFTAPLLEARNMNQVALLILDHALDSAIKISPQTHMTKII
jgi:L-aspartate oxidase